MADEVRKFMASDGFAYVDTYRRQVMNPPGDVKASMERLQERMHGMNLVPPRLFAELRAHEHALNFLLKQQDPGMVLLGEAAAAATDTADADARQELDDALAELRRHLKQAAQREHELQVELVQKNQELSRLNRKLTETYNSVGVGGFAVVVIVLVLIWMLLSR